MVSILAGFFARTKSRLVHSEGIATRSVCHDLDTRVNLLQNDQKQSTSRHECGSYTISSNWTNFSIISMISNGRMSTGLNCTLCNFSLSCTSFSFLMGLSACHIVSGETLGSSRWIEMKSSALCASPSHKSREPSCDFCRAVGSDPYEGNPWKMRC